MSENIGRYNVIFEILTKQQGDIDEIKKKATGLQGVFQTAKGAFAGIIAANVVQSAITSIGSIIKSTIGIAAAAETSAQSFKTLLGSATLAKNLLAELNEFSIQTPFEPAEVEAAAKTLLGFGRSAKVIKEDITLIGNASAATGADLQSLGLVFGQVAGLGKLQGQDALQFINQGIPIYQLLADSLGKSVKEVKDLQTAGKITFDDLRDSFAKASEQGGQFAGALADQSKTYSGLISTFRGNVDELLKSIGQIVLPIIKPIVAAFGTIFQDLNTRFKEIKPQIEDALKTIGPIVKPLFDFFISSIANIGAGIITFIKILAGIPKFIKENETSLKLLGVALVTLNIPLLISTTLLIKNTVASKAKAAADFFLASRTGLLTRAQWLLNAAFLANPIGLIVAAVLALTAGMVYLYKRSETVRNIFAGIGNVFKVLGKEIIAVFKTIETILNQGIGGAAKAVWDKIYENILKQKNEVLNIFKDIFSGENLQESFLKLADKINSLNPLSYFIELGRKAAQAFNDGFEKNKVGEKVAFGSSKTRGRIGAGSFSDANAILKEQEEDARKLKEQEQKLLDEQAEARRQAALAAAAEAEKRRKEALERELLNVKKNFALREKEARDTIKDKKLLAKELEKIEIEKNIAIGTVNQNYKEKGSLNFIELGNQILELKDKYNDLFTDTRKVDILNLLPPVKKDLVVKNAQEVGKALTVLSAQILSASDPKIKQRFQDQFDSIANSIKSVGSPKLNKLTFGQDGFNEDELAGLLPQDRVSALQDFLKKAQSGIQSFKDQVKAGTADPIDYLNVQQLQSDADRVIQILQGIGIESKKTAEQYAEELEQVLVGVANLVKFAALEGINTEIELTDRSIEQQEKRVASAEKNAEKGKVKQLEIEEARLAELTEKREKYVQAQRAISQLEIVQANAVAAANSIKAITAAFAAGGPAGIITGIATGVALAAQIALIVNSVRGSFADIPAFKDGIELFSTKKDGRVTGPGNGRSDSVPAFLSNGERVIDAFRNARIGDMSNEEVTQVIENYKQYPKLENPIIVVGNSKSDNLGIKEEIVALRQSFESLKIVTKLDVNGFYQGVQKRVGNVDRRSRIKR
jgi:tape measure domain-containing protein